jgi:hypothetical protein
MVSLSGFQPDHQGWCLALGFSMSDTLESSGANKRKEENMDGLLGRLNLEEDDIEDFV